MKRLGPIAAIAAATAFLAAPAFADTQAQDQARERAWNGIARLTAAQPLAPRIHAVRRHSFASHTGHSSDPYRKTGGAK